MGTLRILFTTLLSGAIYSVAYGDQPPPLPCAAKDQQCARKALAKSPVRTIAFWKSNLARPLEQRIGPAPEELITYLNLDNINQGFDNTPTAAEISGQFRRDLTGAFDGLPPKVKQLASRKLVGIFVVNDLGGTGYSDYVLGGAARPEGGFMVFDAEVLAKRTANEWSTWKESSPFIAGPDFKLEARIESADQDNRQSAIQYIFLHELGHLLSIGRKLHPRWDQPPPKQHSLRNYAFSRLSWKVADSGKDYASVYDATFPLRKDVVFYFGPKLTADKMPTVYAQLRRTNYPTLYAATSPGDDFADSFASYVHSVLLKRPWEIRIYNGNALVTSYGACWDEARCAAKRSILEKLLN